MDELVGPLSRKNHWYAKKQQLLQKNKKNKKSSFAKNKENILRKYFSFKSPPND